LLHYVLGCVRFIMGSVTGCILLWAANPGAQRILVVGRWLVPGRESNPDLGVHNRTRYPTELSAHLAQLVWCWVIKTRQNDQPGLVWYGRPANYRPRTAELYSCTAAKALSSWLCAFYYGQRTRVRNGFSSLVVGWSPDGNRTRISGFTTERDTQLS